MRLYYAEVLSKLDPKAVVAALAAMADGGITNITLLGSATTERDVVPSRAGVGLALRRTRA